MRQVWRLCRPGWSDDNPVDPEWRDIISTQAYPHLAKPNLPSFCCPPSCSSVRPQYYGRSFDLPLSEIPPVPRIYSPLVMGIADGLAELVRPHLEGAVWGRCYLVSDPEKPCGFVSLYAPMQFSAFRRSMPRSKYNKCRFCGMFNLDYACKRSQRGGEYIDEATMPDGCEARVVEGHCGLVVSPALKDRIEDLYEDLLEYEEIPVKPFVK